MRNVYDSTIFRMINWQSDTHGALRLKITYFYGYPRINVFKAIEWCVCPGVY